MGLFIPEHKNMFQLLAEADGDDGSDIINGGGDNAATNDNDTNAENNTDNTADTDDNSDSDNDDNFDIDTSIDDEGGDDTAGDTGDDTGSDDLESGGDDLGGGGESAPEGEVNKANTDIFTTLTAEEQAIKIKELKKQYNNLYNAINDTIDKIGNIDLDEYTVKVISQVYKSLYDIRDYLYTYITVTFAQKSYMENDGFFNRFLLSFYSINSIVDKLAEGKIKKLDLEDSNKGKTEKKSQNTI